jgi:nucleolin
MATGDDEDEMEGKTTKVVDEEEEEDPAAEEHEEKGRRKRKRKRKAKQAETNGDSKEAVDESNVENKDNTKASQVERTVFVEGIPYVCSEHDVRKFFLDHGLPDIEDIRLPVWQDSGRLRGYGHVVFTEQANQQKAIGLSGKYLQNRYLSIKPAEAPKGGATESRPDRNAEPSLTIMLQNLSYDATEGDIEDVLKECGAIAPGGIRVVRHSSTQRSKGFAYVEFESLSSAKSVFESTTPLVVKGRPCRVDYDHGRMKGSYRAASGRLWEKEHGNTDTGKDDAERVKM